MAEKIEFIPANELPVSEAEEVDVLCIENGELKRKPGANLGGGGVTPDAVFQISSDISGNAPDGANATSVSLVSGGYEAIKSKIEAGLLPTIYFVWQGGEYAFRVWTVTAVEYDSYELQIYMNGWYHRKGICGTFTATITKDDIVSEFGYNGW